MQAIVLDQFGGVEQFKMRELPDPQVKSGEVRIRLRCAAFNPVDWKMREGHYGGNLPKVLGADCSGVIDQVASDVKEFALGDEVMAMPFGQGSNGAYAELLTLPTPFVAKKPNSLSFQQAAACPLVSLTAYRVLIACRAVREGDSVFIAGAGGGVGSIAVALAKHRGARCICTVAGSESSAQFLTQQLGINPEQIILYPGLNHQQLCEKILNSNQGRHFETTCDLVGGEMKKLCLDLTAYSGHFCTILPESETFDFPIWTRGSMTFSKNLSFHCVFVGAEAFSPRREAWHIYAQQLEEISDLLNKKILVPPQVTHVGEFNVKTVSEAHQLLQQGKVKGKLVMTVTS